jgi:DNA-binding response OmpR family regulator
MDLRTLRILVIEDHPRMAEIVRSVLAGLGVSQVQQASTVSQGEARLKEQYFDLLIVDQSLAGESGLDLVRKIRRGGSGPPAYIPIMMLTASGVRKTVAAARDAGVNEFLIKPFTALGLARRLELMIGRPRPFIQASGYIGPDRRRRADPDYTGPERRGSQEPATHGWEPHAKEHRAVR